MEWETYKLDSGDDSFTYEFDSEGPRGRIRKIIKFQYLNYPGGNVYNLGFGNLDEETGDMNDSAVSDNGDQLKILHTVAEAVIDFFGARPQAIILIKGSTSSRTRLYQMKIAGFLSQVSQHFEILGDTGSEWALFQRGVNYKRFLMYKKIE